MRRILSTFTDADKPVLGIHDAVVCKASDVDFARETMVEAYQWLLSTPFKPVIKQTY